MEYEFVAYNRPFYKQAVLLRKEQFFKNMDAANRLIEDDFEQKSVHLVSRIATDVIGTGRLYVIGNEAVISQMAIASNFQHKGIGSQILKHLIDDCKNKEVAKVR